MAQQKSVGYDPGIAKVTEVKAKERLYGTSEIAAILGVPEWRVKNFSEGKVYRLAPTQQLGSGKGSRRLYSLHALYRIAIASQLEKSGFSPAAIGEAVAEISDAKLKSWSEQASGEDADFYLACSGGKWDVVTDKELHRAFKDEVIYPDGGAGLFVLNYSALLHDVVSAINRIEAGEEA